MPPKTIVEMLKKYPPKNKLWDIVNDCGVLGFRVNFTTERSDHNGQPFILDPWFRPFQGRGKVYRDDDGDITYTDFSTTVEGITVVCREYND